MSLQPSAQHDRAGGQFATRVRKTDQGVLSTGQDITPIDGAPQRVGTFRWPGHRPCPRASSIGCRPFSRTRVNPSPTRTPPPGLSQGGLRPAPHENLEAATGGIEFALRTGSNGPRSLDRRQCTTEMARTAPFKVGKDPGPADPEERDRSGGFGFSIERRPKRLFWRVPEEPLDKHRQRC